MIKRGLYRRLLKQINKFYALLIPNSNTAPKSQISPLIVIVITQKPWQSLGTDFAKA